MMTTKTATTFLRHRWYVVRRHLPVLLVYGLILTLGVIGTHESDRFLTERNVTNVLRQGTFLGTVALGEMLVILTGGIDLSVGSVVKLSVLVSAVLMDGNPDNTWKAIVGTLGLGMLIGLTHALIITRLKVAPFIVTLGSFSVLRGIALSISTRPIGRASREFLQIYDRKVGPLPALVVGFFVLAVVIAFVLRRTALGRHIYAVGGNEQVARLSGIQVDRVKFIVYIACSTLASATGLLWLSRMGVGDPVIGDGLELQVITAVILGGTSLMGGRGSVIGTLGGVLLLGLTSNLLVVLNVNQWIQQLIQGIIIVGAVALYKQEGRE